MTDFEFLKKYVKERGDSLTDFVATKEDLKSLARALAKELPVHHWLSLFVGLEPTERRNYVSYRLGRVMEYLPELEPEINKILEDGYQENEEAIEEK